MFIERFDRMTMDQGLMTTPRMIRSTIFALLFALLGPARVYAEPFNGWRGNGTGLWPDARPPLEWRRIPKGVMTELRAHVDRPEGFDSPEINPAPNDAQDGKRNEFRS